jgi:hypothetical protein
LNRLSLSKKISRAQLFQYFIVALLSIQFHFNSRVGDDWPNSNTPSYIVWRYGQLSLTTFWNEISYWTAAWANGQGRFFPIAVIQTQSVFTLFESQSQVRIFYSIVFIVFCFIWLNLIKQALGQKIAASYFVIALAFSMQFRGDFEPHIGFGQLLIWASIWFGLTVLTLFKALEVKTSFSRMTLLSSSGVLYFICLCQYELTFLLFPMIPLILYLRDLSIEEIPDFKKWVTFRIRTMTPVLTATTIYLGIVFLYLRPKANPDGAYVLGFNTYQSIRAFIIQFIASFPTAAHSVGDTFKLPMNIEYFFLAILISFLYLISLKFMGNFEQEYNFQRNYLHGYEKKKLHISLFISLYFACVPAVMISLQPAWWSRLQLGSSYLGVFFAEIGVAILIASTATHFDVKSVFLKLNKKRNIHMERNTRKSFLQNNTTFQFITTLLIFITILSNFRMIETTKNRDNISRSWSALTSEKSFFSKLSDRDFLFSTTFNDAYEINVANIYVRTGVRLGQIFYPPSVWSDYLECQQYESCPLDNIREKSATTLVNHARGEYAVAKLTRQKGFEGDWPSILSKPGALASSSFWYFNIFMITESTALAYLVPMVDDPQNALSIPGKAIVYTMVLDDSPVITPAFMGICLVPSTDPEKAPALVGGVKILKWQLPSLYLSPSGQIMDLEDKVDIRRVVTGSC